ncbi:alpha/beta hydrolase [Paralimibaculum aggregatum]|uniref:Alpha/beta hydrolase n=1 Tax=Paralimibaculum aggregatum TaxID=3036245 RepID=A0ABQ6LK80_9RHOB|nr:alpha/beta fold hydrolase [Limibaculum sp. NKW23]GMG81188.1 alpha/beta hydrolase [Limibaculum sp. NKW23]
MERIWVEGGDGCRLALHLAGPEGAPAILLVHGWSQHSLAWRKQLAGPLAGRFRLGAVDLRGHGASDAPPAPAGYTDPALWAADIAACLAALGPGPAVAVGWSMGGWVLGDYIAAHGCAGLAGLVLVGSSARVGAAADPAVLARRRPDVRAEGMYSKDHGVQITAAINFARAMTLGTLSKNDLATMVGWQMLVRPEVRRACRMRDADWRAALAGVTVPALVIQGAGERVCLPEVYQEVLGCIPGAEGQIFAGSGHLPFWEEPERFDTALGGFAARALGMEAAA